MEWGCVSHMKNSCGCKATTADDGQSCTLVMQSFESVTRPHIAAHYIHHLMGLHCFLFVFMLS